MESITIGQIAVAITFLVGLISGIAYLRKHLKDWLSNSLKEQFDGIKDDIQDLKEKINNADMESCKNYLVIFLSDAKKGEVGEVERQRFWEQYEYYTKHGGNSYIKEEVEKLKANGKL